MRIHCARTKWCKMICKRSADKKGSRGHRCNRFVKALLTENDDLAKVC